jgi:hypothetical protein
VQLFTALRVAGLIVVVKAILIGAVYWRRAELLGRPLEPAAVVCAALVAVTVAGVAVMIAARYSGDRR